MQGLVCLGEYAFDENIETDDPDVIPNDNAVEPDENDGGNDAENKASSKGDGCSLIVF